MKILITGAGAREHAIGWKIQHHHPDAQLFFAPGNAGMATLGECVNLTSNADILDFAQRQKIDFTIVGAEDKLADGIVDDFTAVGLSIFGPHQSAARLESSKTFAKDFMQRHGVKTASYQNFTDYSAAQTYLDAQPLPIVIKASGLAAGKGVIICESREAANQALHEIMLEKKFGDAGQSVVIEQFLEGFEVSILSVCAGTTITSWRSAMDHKQAYDGDIGPNTGGMGVVAPHPFWTAELEQQFITDIVEPTAQGLAADDLSFSGFIFFGLMITEDGTYLLEYNLRLGDPETQAILPLLETDLLAILEAANAGESRIPEWRDEATCALTIAAEGYPASYTRDIPIPDLSSCIAKPFVAGIKQNASGNWLSSGGRILTLVGSGQSLEQARTQAYAEAERLDIPNTFYRNDIGLRHNPLISEDD